MLTCPCGFFFCWSEDEGVVGSSLGVCNVRAPTLTEKGVSVHSTGLVREAGEHVGA